MEAELGKIAVPVRVAASRDDTLVPWSRSERFAAGLPSTPLELAPGGGHAHDVTAAAFFNRSLPASLAGTADLALSALEISA